MNKLSGQTPWWIPIVVLILTGVGFLIKTVIEQELKEPTVLVGSLKNAPQNAACFLHSHKEKTIPVHGETGFFRFDDISIGSHVVVCTAADSPPVWAQVDVVRGMNNKIQINFRKIGPSDTRKHLEPPGTKKLIHEPRDSQVSIPSLQEQSRFYSSLADRQYQAAISEQSQKDLRVKLFLESKENYEEALLLAPDDSRLRTKLDVVRKAINTSRGG